MHELEGEALEVVAVGEGGAVVGVVCEGSNVEAGVSVRGAGVAADGEEARIAFAEVPDVGQEAGNA